MRAAAIAVLLLATAAPAAAPASPDDFDLFRTRESALRSREAAYWKEYQGRFTEALRLYALPPRNAYSDPSLPQDATYDYAPFHSLYGEFAALEESRAEAAEALAASGHARALPTLFAMFLDAAKAADGADAELADSMPPIGRSMCDLHPGIQRYGTGRYLARLVPALANSPGAAAFLAGEGWRKAAQQDGRRSLLRRVGVIDALARCEGPEVPPFLKERLAEKGDALRVAAAEALLPRGQEATASLLPLLQDPHPAVRFAVLDGLRKQEKPDVLWISGLLGAYHAAEGRYRAGIHAELRRLTRQEIGDDPEAWMVWYARNAAAIQDRSFDASRIPVEKGGGDPPAPGFSFYGIPTASRAAVFLLQADPVLQLPVDVEVLATQHPRRWPDRTRRTWSDPPVVHMAVLLDQLRACLEGAPDGSRAGFLALGGKNEARPFHPDLLPTGRPVVEGASKWLEEQVLSGWGGAYEGLVAALALTGQEADANPHRDKGPTADTVFFVDSGDPRGGRFVTARPVVEAFRRLHRFHRVVVHCIRIANEKDEAEEVMKGIAEASGGTYLWLRKPPP